MKCPFCQTRETEFFLRAKSTHGARIVSNEHFTFARCLGCGSVFPMVFVGEDYYSKYYPTDYYKIFPAIKHLNIFYRKINFAFLNFIVKSFVKRGRVLDFGTGRGDFLVSLGNEYKKFAVEVNPQARKILKTISSLTVASDLDGLKKTQKFDLITSFHVLEHLSDPATVISELAGKVKKGGYLILTTPNNNSFGLKTAGDKWFHLDAPRHLLIFNLMGLKKILKKEKLKLVLVMGSFIEYPLDLFWSWFNSVKTRLLLINFFLVLLILPASLIVKLFQVFLPDRAETFMIVCRKN